MAFVENWSPKIGEKVVTTEDFENLAGTMKAGSVVTITNIGERGYDIVDENGNRVTECGWTGFKQYQE